MWAPDLFPFRYPANLSLHRACSTFFLLCKSSVLSLQLSLSTAVLHSPLSLSSNRRQWRHSLLKIHNLLLLLRRRLRFLRSTTVSEFILFLTGNLCALILAANLGFSIDVGFVEVNLGRICEGGGKRR